MVDINLLSFRNAAGLLRVTVEAQNRFLEFWVSATFAVIIACLGFRSLMKAHSGLAAVMFAACSVNMFSRRLLAQSTVFLDGGEMLTFLESGNQLQMFDLSRSYALVTVIVGITSTLFFIWLTFKNRKVPRAAT